MTIAICTACGTKKFGAFSPCDECGFTPSSNDERAKSVLLSDHHYTQAQLDELSRAIKVGQTILYDSASVAQYARTFDILDSDPDALQCKNCGEDLESFDETLCPKCRDLTFRPSAP
jgi:RecJ-like exonuclease